MHIKNFTFSILASNDELVHNDKFSELQRKHVIAYVFQNHRKLGAQGAMLPRKIIKISKGMFGLRIG